MIDWSRVDDLRDEVGDEDFREVVDLFLDEVDEVIERMKHHPTHSSIEKDLHFLKGSSLNLGFAGCHRSRPIVQQGAQRAHGPPAAPMHDA